MFRLSAQGGAREPVFKTSTRYVLYVVSSKKYTWLQYEKRQIQAPGTTFSTFSDGVRLEGGHGKCCRFATLKGVYQGAHICLAKLWFKGKVRSYDSRAELRNVLQEKWRCRGGSSCRFDRKVGIFFCGQCNTGGLQPPDLAFLQCTKSVLIRRYIRRGLLVNQTQ